ncbi:DarT ssDNA thymidine ADP-ribosyltransferase family protein [Bathymodiolus thermophilus thioautotrophic gill symbiont]|uniref:DarT domain-containing protein n=1 Tax=Bathymodiolus thermophilus thioautotrophic gill symbiont TaxID=2360 RepID=A0A1J5TVU6_9GAMM|nr:translation initiation factor IF-2 N-terminal domain-containing protein [Bathymodiolus thermophilus thioautotrophic gill symbiont]OIR24955.1 hypothetical protein BGC33_05015 [Bathymodiolus thermophilus thioautotrophic gill symbiont]
MTHTVQSLSKLLKKTEEEVITILANAGIEGKTADSNISRDDRKVLMNSLLKRSSKSSIYVPRQPSATTSASTETRDRVANISLDKIDEILVKNENVKPSKIEIDFTAKKNIALSIPIVHQNIVKNKDKLTEVSLFFDYVFHMTHIDNLRTILKNGLLPHNNPYKKIDISNQSVNQKRNKIKAVYENNLHDYVPFYFNCRNAMLYKTQKEFGKNIIILLFKKDIMLENGTVFTNKNAATKDVKFTNDIKDLLNNDFINWDDVNAKSWNNDGNNLDKHLKQTMMAEILLLNGVDSDRIHTICCQTNYIKDFITNCFAINGSEINVCNTDKIFF